MSPESYVGGTRYDEKKTTSRGLCSFEEKEEKEKAMSLHDKSPLSKDRLSPHNTKGGMLRRGGEKKLLCTAAVLPRPSLILWGP